MTQYTLVRHTGYDIGKHAEFEFAVELRGITTRQVAMVERAGGLVFPDYLSASEAEEAENYPPKVTGLIPHVRGTFSTKVKIDGGPLYVPAKAEVEA